jgi:hypothetical protein
MKPASLAYCIVAIISVASACTPGPKKARYTVDQYLADREMMKKKVEECGNNPGELGDDPDCINAGTAASLDGLGSLRDLPPIFGSAGSTDKPQGSSTR